MSSWRTVSYLGDLRGNSLDGAVPRAGRRWPIMISGIGEGGLNLARLSTPNFCTVVLVMTFSMALLTKAAY